MTKMKKVDYCQNRFQSFHILERSLYHWPMAVLGAIKTKHTISLNHVLLLLLLLLFPCSESSFHTRQNHVNV